MLDYFMKGWLVFLFLISFASASVSVDNYDVKSEYFLFDEISGIVNLNIRGESYNESIILSDGKRIGLGSFLEDNGVDFECSPRDCSENYDYSSGATEKIIPLSLLGEEYVGFVLKGEDIVLDNISFKMRSDFVRGSRQPLLLEFFEEETWGFDKFSNEFLLRNWGCFDSTQKKVGPLIGSSFYCEMVSINNTNVLKVGADVEGSGGELDMAVYPEGGFGSSWECSFDPKIEDGCVVNAEVGDVFPEGNYWVCVGAKSLSGYNIYEDNVGKNCGFAYDNGPVNSVKDYGIFVQGVNYADANVMGEVSFGREYIDAANAIIYERYGGDCSEGCVLPLKVSGIPQNLRISDVNLVYTDNSEWRSNNMVYDLESSSAKVDFNGTLDLGLLGIVVSKAGEYSAKLSGKDLFRENIKILPAPIISSVFPLSPPAGVPVPFYVDIDFEGNKSLSYKWNFGDGSEVVVTDVPYTVHTYNDLKNYSLSLIVSAGGNLTSDGEFEIGVISPEEAVSVGLKDRRVSLQSVRRSIESFPGWYGSELMKILEVARFEDELSRMERAQNNSFDAEDFRDIAVELYGLNIPVVVGANSFESPFLMSELEDVDIEPVMIISGSISGAENEDYVKPILTWQNENVDATMKGRNIFVSYLDGSDLDILSVFDIEVTSKSNEESYFVINRQFDELYFNGNVGERKAGNSVVIILEPGAKKSFEFYYKDDARGKFFVSPRLSSIVLEADIDMSCNFDLICDESMGENPDSCRSDCKPTEKAVFFLILAVLFFLIIYSILQIWYKRHYEAYLFRDGSQLFNLLMYVTNARARGMEDKQIARELKSKGWSSERVDYVLRKSVGKTIGMVEIIPIERVSAWLRNRKARQEVARAMEVATRVQQQGSDFRRVP